MDALVESMMIANERLPFASYPLSRVLLSQVVADLFETRVEILVPRAVIAFSQQLGKTGSTVSKVEPAGEDNHPRAVGSVVARTRRLGAVGIDAEADLGAGTNSSEFFAVHSTPHAQGLSPFRPAVPPDSQAVFLRH